MREYTVNTKRSPEKMRQHRKYTRSDEHERRCPCLCTIPQHAGRQTSEVDCAGVRRGAARRRGLDRHSRGDELAVGLCRVREWEELNERVARVAVDDEARRREERIRVVQEGCAKNEVGVGDLVFREWLELWEG
jgi:hypothetical protein